MCMYVHMYVYMCVLVNYPVVCMCVSAASVCTCVSPYQCNVYQYICVLVHSV